MMQFKNEMMQKSIFCFISFGYFMLQEQKTILQV